MGLGVGRAQPETGLEGGRDQIRTPGDDPGVLGRCLTLVAWERQGQAGVTIQVMGDTPSLGVFKKRREVALGDR